MQVGEIDIDSELVASSQKLDGKEEARIMMLNNGCLCCTVRDDLVDMLSELVGLCMGDRYSSTWSSACHQLQLLVMHVCTVQFMTRLLDASTSLRRTTEVRIIASWHAGKQAAGVRPRGDRDHWAGLASAHHPGGCDFCRAIAIAPANN